MLKLRELEAKWLFWELGWVTLRVCQDYDSKSGFYIRGSTINGRCDGTFVWGHYDTHQAARMELARLEPDEVFTNTCKHLTYTPTHQQRF